MKALNVKCDICGWFEVIKGGYYKGLKRWYNVPCPKCGKTTIITDRDLALYRMAKAIDGLSKLYEKATGTKAKQVVLDTASGKCVITGIKESPDD